MTYSERSRSAAANSSAPFSGWKTSCTMPERSRRSTKISPPWSRRLCTQPETRAGEPARSAARSPAQVSRYGLARGARLTACPGCAGSAPRRRPRAVALLARLHVLQDRRVVAHQGNVASAEPVGVLELPLARPPGELDLRVQARAARLVDDPERVARAGPARRRRRRGRPAARPPAAGPTRAASARSPPPSRSPAWPARRASRRGRRSARRRRRRSARRARRR